MALRISKKERLKLNQKNASVRKKQNRLFDIFGITPNFITRSASTFSTRQEFNRYKQEVRKFLNRSTGNFIKGGTYVKTIGYEKIDGKRVPIQRQFAFPIPRIEANRIKREFEKHNRYIKKQWELFNKTQFKIRQKPQDTTVAHQIYMKSPFDPTSIRSDVKSGSYMPLIFNPKKISSAKALQRAKYVAKRFQSPKSLREKQARFKENYKAALYNTFGNLSLPLRQLIDDMSTNEFLAWVESEEFIDISYIYDPTSAKEIITYLTNSLIDFMNENKIETATSDIDKELAENLLNVDSATIIKEYNKGSYGGQRIGFTKGKIRYYIDITPEEVEALNMGLLSIDEILSWDTRVKRYPKSN